VAALATIGDARGFRAALNSIAGAAAGGVVAAKQAASERFADNVITCDSVRPDAAPAREESCGWLRIAGTRTSLASSGDESGYRSDEFTYQLGGQKEVAPDWFVGASLGYAKSWLNGSEDGTKASGESSLFGLMLKRRSGPWTLTGVIDGGYGWYRSQRTVAVGTTSGMATGSPQVGHGGLHLQAAYQAALGSWYLRPKVTGALIYRGMSGYKESGSTPFNLAVKPSTDVIGSLAPMLEIGHVGTMAGLGTWRGYVGLGATVSFNNDWTSEAIFRQAPAGITPFRVTSRLPDAAAKLEAGLTLFSLGGVEGKLAYSAWLAPGFSEQTLVGRLAYPF
jgi:uncharacterized protein with beta-barrel porin domain